MEFNQKLWNLIKLTRIFNIKVVKIISGNTLTQKGECITKFWNSSNEKWIKLESNIGLNESNSNIKHKTSEF